MINKKKIATMSNLARYEKRFGKDDKLIDNYFRYDYISRRNISNIVLVIIFTTICVLIYQVNNIYNEELIIDLEQLKEMMISSVWFIAFVSVIYTFIGFVIYNNEYEEKSSRLKTFYKNIEKLNE